MKDAWTESELLRHPVKTIIAHKLESVSFGIVSVVVLLLLFPFTIRSVAAEAFVILPVVWFSLKFIKPKKAKAIALRFWFVIMVLLIFASLCPYLVAPKPLYIAVLATNNPLETKLCTLESGGEEIGSVMLLSNTDFIRQCLTPALCKFLPGSFRALAKTESANGSYYTLPVFKGFIFNLGELGEIPSRKSIYFPSVFVARGVDLFLVKPNKSAEQTDGKLNNYYFRWYLINGPLVNFAYTQYPNTIPWEAIQVQNEQDVSVLIYAALLDRTLEFFATGKTEQAINGLDTAAAVVPSQNLEGARLAALKYTVIKQSLLGNIGDLQSLPLLHHAYDLLLESRGDPRFKEKDPLVNWLLDLLSGGYQYWAWSTKFFDRVNTLQSIPHLADDEAGQNRHTDALEKSFQGQTYSEIMKSIQSANYSSADLHFVKYLVFGRFLTHAIGFIGDEKLDANATIAKILEEAKEADPLMHFIDSSLAAKRELGPDPYSIQMVGLLEFIQQLPLRFGTNDSAAPKDSAALKYLLSGASRFPIFNDITNIIVWFPNNTNSIKITRELADLPCWRSAYLFWFSGWSMNAVSDINQHDYPRIQTSESPLAKFDILAALSKYGNDYFTKDMGGKGRTFLPGLFFLAWYAQTFDLDNSQDLKNQFEAEAKIPFDTFLSKLYPPENSYENVPWPINQSVLQ